MNAEKLLKELEYEIMWDFCFAWRMLDQHCKNSDYYHAIQDWENYETAVQNKWSYFEALNAIIGYVAKVKNANYGILSKALINKTLRKVR